MYERMYGNMLTNLFPPEMRQVAVTIVNFHKVQHHTEIFIF